MFGRLGNALAAAFIRRGSRTYKPNGARERHRRMVQMAKGMLKKENLGTVLLLSQRGRKAA